MSTNIKTPPGTQLFTNSIGIKNQANINFEINVPNGTYTAPLDVLSINPRTPIVQAVASDQNQNADNYSLNVYSICFIGYTGDDPAIGSVTKKLNAFYQTDADNHTVLNVYITYDETPQKCSKFSCYQFNFQIKNISNSIKTINVALWDTDPETSRGTETTVKKPVPTEL